MPGKNTQDWTDDAAFWNEAWADMEQRLDGQEPKKRGLVWTRWIVLLVLLLAGVVTARLLNGFEITDPAVSATSAPAIEQSNPTPPDGVKSSAIAPPAATARAGGDNEVPVSSIPVPAATKPLKQVSGQAGPGQASPSKTPNEGFVSSADNLPPDTQQPENSSEKASQIVAAPDVDSQAPDTKAISVKAEPTQLPAGVAPLAPQTPILSYSLPLPETTIGGQKASGLPLFVEAGGNIALGRQTPGFLVGVGTQLVRNGRFSIPVSLRYRKDFMRLGEGGGGETDDQATIGAPTADLAENPIEALRVVSGTQATALTTTGLELATGIQYQISRKFSISATLGGEYLLSADGLIDAVREGDLISYTFNNRDQADFDLTVAFNNVSASNLSYSGVSGSSGINRFRLRTGVHFGYQVVPRFTLVAGVSSVTTPIYRSELLRVRPTQFQVGLRYRLR